MGPFADVLMDRQFRRTLGSPGCERIMQLMLQGLIIDRDVAEIEFTPQQAMNPDDDSKDVYIDVGCRDSSGRRFVVEVQLAPRRGFYERGVYNSTFAIQQQMTRGDNRFPFDAVYFIGFMDFTIHPQDDRVLYRYRLHEETSGELMTDRLEYIFLELPNCGRALTEGAEWADNLGYVLHNMRNLKERPDGLEGEFWDLLFKSAESLHLHPRNGPNT